LDPVVRIAETRRKGACAGNAANRACSEWSGVLACQQQSLG